MRSENTRDRGSSGGQRGFESLEEFLAFAESKISYGARFKFTNSDGSEEWINTTNTCEAVRRISLFLGSPEKISSITLHDGRMIVAHHNLASLTQNLRWAAGLDSDSKPKPRPEGFSSASARWPETAKLWFWSNGGPGWDGRPGKYHELQKKVNAEEPKFAKPEMKTIPEPHPCEVGV